MRTAIREPMVVYYYRLAQLQRAYEVKQDIKYTPIRLGYYESEMNPPFNKEWLGNVEHCLWQYNQSCFKKYRPSKAEAINILRSRSKVDEALALVIELDQQEVVRWYSVLAVFEIINEAIGFVNQCINIVRAKNKKPASKV